MKKIGTSLSVSRSFDTPAERDMDFVPGRKVFDELLEALPPAAKVKAQAAAKKASDALWNFLDGVHSKPCHAVQ